MNIIHDTYPAHAGLQLEAEGSVLVRYTKSFQKALSRCENELSAGEHHPKRWMEEESLPIRLRIEDRAAIGLGHARLLLLSLNR